MMYSLIRRNKRPTVLRHLVGALARDVAACAKPPSVLPSHHILCAGTYTPVFARLAAESALAACPAHLRSDFRVFIHVDGVARGVRGDLMAWLGEVPGVELTYGLFGILAQDHIPGKWHQVMINDVVKAFQAEPHIAFVDADLFLVDDGWWNAHLPLLNDKLFSVSLGKRGYAKGLRGGEEFSAGKTQLFTVNTRIYQAINRQRFTKDRAAIAGLKRDFPDVDWQISRPDSQVECSLRAQAMGYPVVDVYDRVTHCHVGGFSHLSYNKFHDHENPERLQAISSWTASARLLKRTLDYFDRRGWGRFVDAAFRRNMEQTRGFIAEHPLLQELSVTVPPTSHEVVFDTLVAKTV